MTTRPTTDTPYHLPVLVDEVAALLTPALANGGWMIDGTLGGGGHAERILRDAPEARVLGIDRDSDAIAFAGERLREFGKRLVLVHAPFDRIEEVRSEAGVEGDQARMIVRAALLDLGVSSHQLDTDARGFSFQGNAPLDMRMDRDRDRPASDLVATLSHGELAKMFRELGEEKNAGRIAAMILRRREKKPITTTRDLVEAVLEAFGGRERIGKIHVATRTFQALRMAVNDELGQLIRALPKFFDALAVGGRLAVISFHSLEDRIVKHAFRDLATGCICPPEFPVCRCGLTPRAKLLTRKGLRASDEESARNPRARSAILRAVEKISENREPM